MNQDSRVSINIVKVVSSPIVLLASWVRFAKSKVVCLNEDKDNVLHLFLANFTFLWVFVEFIFVSICSVINFFPILFRLMVHSLLGWSNQGLFFIFKYLYNINQILSQILPNT